MQHTLPGHPLMTCRVVRGQNFYWRTSLYLGARYIYRVNVSEGVSLYVRCRGMRRPSLRVLATLRLDTGDQLLPCVWQSAVTCNI